MSVSKKNYQESIVPRVWNWYDINRILTVELIKIIEDVGIEHIGRYLTNLFAGKEKFMDLHKWFSKSYGLYTQDERQKYKDDQPQIDPLQIYLSYSMYSLSKETRIARINAIFIALNINLNFVDVDFTGMPTPLGIKSLPFKPLEDVQMLWDYFIKLELKESLLKEDLKKALRVYGVDISLLSIFSFWVRPDRIIPVDKWTIEMIRRFQLLDFPKSNLSAADIFYKINFERDITDVLRITGAKSIVDLVDKAEKNTRIIQSETIETNEKHPLPNSKIPNSLKDSNHFRILGIKMLNENILLPILKKGTLYKFYSGFDLKNNIVKLEPDIYRNLYSSDNARCRVNISAIVGENGSGKSSLIDLIHLLNYNISFQLGWVTKDYKDRPLQKIIDVDFDLYYISDHLYRINSIKLEKVQLWEVEKQKWVHKPIDNEFLRSFFYTVSVNYSIYSLNANCYPFRFDWLSSLMHKNDNYQSPIVITPQRTEGDIVINRELQLSKQRLLLNFINLRQADEQQNFFTFKDVLGKKKFTHIIITGFSAKLKIIDRCLSRPIPDKGMYPLNLEDISAFTFRYKEAKEKWKKVLRWLLDKFEVNYRIKQRYEVYLLHKLYMISFRYYKEEHYYLLFENMIKRSSTINEDGFKEFINKVFENESHFTDKLKQALYFLKYKNVLERHYAIDKKSEIDELNRVLVGLNLNTHSKFIRANLEKREIQEELNFNPDKYLKNLIIPPFFTYTFIVNNDDSVSFETFSSGEKQLLNSISTLTYHIFNIESNHYGNPDGVKYSNVNLILDEIELYFHPAYQRQYIDKLTSIIGQLPLENLRNINIIMSTHSPFILSDIPNQYVLKLQDGLPRPTDEVNSFASNIHDLLKDEFFMKGGTMGSFASRYIDSLVTELTSKEKLGNSRKESLKNNIELIGEPLIKNALLKLWGEHFGQPTYEQLYKLYLEQNP